MPYDKKRKQKDIEPELITFLEKEIKRENYECVPPEEEVRRMVSSPLPYNKRYISFVFFKLRAARSVSVFHPLREVMRIYYEEPKNRDKMVFARQCSSHGKRIGFKVILSRAHYRFTELALLRRFWSRTYERDFNPTQVMVDVSDDAMISLAQFKEQLDKDKPTVPIHKKWTDS